MPDTPAPAPMSSGFIRDHFAVVVVVFIFCLLFTAYLIEIHWTGNDAVITWLQNKMSDLISAVLMGVTGGAAAAKLAQK
jgi:hypothetical protein